MIKKIILMVLFVLLTAHAIYSQGQVGQVCFPNCIDTQDTLLRAADGAGTVLNSSITISATSITLLDGSRFPSSGLGVMEGEKFTWSDKSGVNTLTGVVRGVRGTFAAAHASGVGVRMSLVKDYHELVRDALIAAEIKVGSGASVAANNKYLKGTGIGTSAWSDILSADVIAALGFTPLSPANNLSEVNAVTARTNLGLGTAAIKDVPASGNASASQVVKGDDSRLSDARTPVTHTHTASQITDFNASVDARISYPVTSVAGRTGAITLSESDIANLVSDLAAKQNALGFTPENASNKDATGGYAGLTLFKINFKNVANTFISFLTNTNTAARTYTFQDRNGTIADDTDLALKANLVSPSFTTPNIGAATGTSVNLSGSTPITFNTSGKIVINGDGDWGFQNNAGTSFTRIRIKGGFSLMASNGLLLQSDNGAAHWEYSTDNVHNLKSGGAYGFSPSASDPTAGADTTMTRVAAGIMQFNNAIKIGSTTTKPTCSSATRGYIYHFYGGTGVKDTVEVCAKDVADVYAWRTIY